MTHQPSTEQNRQTNVPPSVVGAAAAVGERALTDQGVSDRAESIAPVDLKAISVGGSPTETNPVRAASQAEALPELAAEHLRNFPFVAPDNIAQCRFWYEGSFDPLGKHHLEIFLRTMELGFERATLALVYQNPYKPNSTPYAHRYEMAKQTIEAAGLTVVHDPREKGVCMYRPDQEDKFHVDRMRAIYGKDNYILIGPDNFDSAIRRNVLWVHPEEIRSHPGAIHTFGFRAMYENLHGFRPRVLVYPELDPVHSTDIRQGRVLPPPPVQAYVAQHGLYQAKQSGTVVPGPAIPTVDTRNHITPEEALRRLRLENKICDHLAALNMMNPPVREAVHRTLAGFDRCELAELSLTLTTMDKPVTTEDTALMVGDGGQTGLPKRYSRPVAATARLRNAVLETLVGHELHVDGAEDLLASIESGKQVLLVGNCSGWGDLGLLPLALQMSDLGSIGDRMTFVTPRIISESPFVRFLFGSSVGRAFAPTPDQVDSCQLESAFGAGLSRLSKDVLVAVFPEQRPSDNGIRPFQPGFMAELGERIRREDVDPSRLVIIPWAQRGGADIRRGTLSSFSEETPLMVRFGSAVSTQLLMGIMDNEGGPIASHLLGHLVAELLPPEHRGVYGSYPERYSDITGATPAVIPAVLEDIKSAGEIVRRIKERASGPVH